MTEEVKKRQIVIETDGNSINVVKNETAGNLELASILSMILNKLTIK
jgi:hypothetical protein